jgi:hypothetical protein
MTKQQIFQIVSDELTAGTNALDDDEVRELSEAIAEKLVEHMEETEEEERDWSGFERSLTR